MTREARDYTGKLCPMPTPSSTYSMRTSYEEGIIELWASHSAFAVVYGLQIQSGLSYAEAAKALGQALMHVAQCEGKLD